MNSKTIVILFAITVVVVMMTIHEADAQRPGRCAKRCTGGPNDRCVPCGLRCPPTCRNPRPRPCGPCIRNVCRCNNGFVRAPNGRCVRRNQCPKNG